MAEARAERERALGWLAAIIDPGVDPSDYHGWDIQSSDVLAIPYTEISEDYRQRLSQVLTAAGANSITYLPSPNAVESEVAETTNPAGRPGSSETSLDGDSNREERQHGEVYQTHSPTENQATEMAPDGSPSV